MKKLILTIDEENDGEDMITALEEVLNQMRKGYSSGYYPTWNLENN